MDEVYKLPKIAFPEVTGSTVSFYSEYAGLPLKKCEVAINAWQEGSGDPSPENVRPIHGFSEVNVTANEVVHTIQLGQEVYGAEVDVVNGVAHCTWGEVDLGDIYFNRTSGANGYYQQYGGELPNFKKISAYYRPIPIKCELFKTLTTNSYPQEDLGLCVTINSAQLKIRYDAITNIEDFKQAVSGHKLIYELAEPFTVQLTPAQIETIQGNNTIFADTGDTTVQYIRVY